MEAFRLFFFYVWIKNFLRAFVLPFAPLARSSITSFHDLAHSPCSSRLPYLFSSLGSLPSQTSLSAPKTTLKPEVVRKIALLILISANFLLLWHFTFFSVSFSFPPILPSRLHKLAVYLKCVLLTNVFVLWMRRTQKHFKRFVFQKNYIRESSGIWIKTTHNKCPFERCLQKVFNDLWHSSSLPFF